MKASDFLAKLISRKEGDGNWDGFVIEIYVNVNETATLNHGQTPLIKERIQLEYAELAEKKFDRLTRLHVAMDIAGFINTCNNP